MTKSAYRNAGRSATEHESRCRGESACADCGQRTAALFRASPKRVSPPSATRRVFAATTDTKCCASRNAAKMPHGRTRRTSDRSHCQEGITRKISVGVMGRRTAADFRAFRVGVAVSCPVDRRDPKGEMTRRLPAKVGAVSGHRIGHRKANRPSSEGGGASFQRRQPLGGQRVFVFPARGGISSI